MLSKALKQFISDHRSDDTARLLLQRHRYPDIDVAFAVQQIEGRRKARTKLPELSANDDFVFPPHLNLEQASSEATALFKASRYAAGKQVIDITGGLGIDTIFMARVAKNVTYIEQDAELLQIAEENFKTLGLSNIRCLCGNSAELLASGQLCADLVYADPARRDQQGRRMVSLADCTPDIAALLPTLLDIAPQVLIKTSPMLDISLAKRQLGSVPDTAVVALRNECKELLFFCSRDAAVSTATLCVDIAADGRETTFQPTAEEMRAMPPVVNQVGQYLYDPSVAVVKAQTVKALANRFGLSLLHSGSRLGTSNELAEGYMGRVFQVVEVLSVSAKDVRAALPSGKANVVSRNFPQSADEIRNKLKIADGGDDFLIATVMDGGKKVLILCRRVG